MKSAAQVIPLICLLFITLFFSACGKETTVRDYRGNESGPNENYGLIDSQNSGKSSLFGQWKPSEKDKRYLETLKEATVKDKIYSWTTLSPAIIVKALPYSAKVARAAERVYGDNPFFYNEVRRWGRISASAPGAPVVILMGLYMPNLKEKDVTELERFRPRLVTADGLELKPLEIKRYGRASAFIVEHFSVFDHWEEVYMVKFPAPAKSWPAGPLSFKLYWAGGSQNLSLKTE